MSKKKSHLICHPGSALLDFVIFSRNNGNKHKKSQNAYGVYKFMNYCNLMKETEKKKYRRISKRVEKVKKGGGVVFEIAG